MLHDKFFPINFEEQLIFQQRNRQSAIFPGTVHFQNDTNPTRSFEDIFPRARKPRENRGRWCEPPFSTGENDKGVPFGSFPALPSPWKQTGGEEASFGMEWKMGSQLKARLASMNRCVFCPLKAHTFVPTLTSERAVIFWHFFGDQLTFCGWMERTDSHALSLVAWLKWKFPANWNR